MSNWQRRSFIASGAALAAGGVVAAVGAGEETTDESREPVDEPTGWSSYRGNAANSGYVATDSFPKPDELVWEYEDTGDLAAVSGTVYLRTDDGELHAIDAQDGDLEWKQENLTAQGTPAVADGTVYVAGEQLTAFDAEDGERLWELDLDSGESVSSPTVAYETVYVIADETLYAVDAADGSITWKHDYISVETHRRGPDGGQTLTEERPFHPTLVAIANETVYVRTVAYSNEEYEDDDWEFVGRGALDATTGDKLWTNNLSREMNPYLEGTYPIVSGDQVYFVSGAGYPNYQFEGGPVDGFDLESGEEPKGGSSAIPVASNNEFRVTGSIRGMAVFDILREESVWSRRNPVHIENTPFLNPLIVGDTLIVYNNDWVQEEYDGRTLLGFDIEDGTVKWSLSVDDLDNNDTVRADENTIYITTSEGLLALRSSPENDGDSDDESTEDEETDEEDENGEEESEGSSEDDGETTEEDTESDEEVEEEDDDPDDEDQDETDESDGDDDSGINDEVANEGESDEEEEESESDTVPGFTTGAGIVGGALSLEWLRRRAATEPEE